MTPEEDQILWMMPSGFEDFITITRRRATAEGYNAEAVAVAFAVVAASFADEPAKSIELCESIWEYLSLNGDVRRVLLSLTNTEGVDFDSKTTVFCTLAIMCSNRLGADMRQFVVAEALRVKHLPIPGQERVRLAKTLFYAPTEYIAAYHDAIRTAALGG